MAGAVNMPLIFGGILGGALFIHYGVGLAKQGFGTVQGAGPPAGSGSSTSSTSGKLFGATGGFPPGVDPVPGASISRADQGLDGTASTFLAPWDGKVIYSTSSDPGWDGGGYVAIQSTADPSKVFYAAEGLTPTVHVGQTVTAGQQIATPRPSPYNGINGNFEIGLANPNAPSQPLAQVISDPRQMVLEWVAWLEHLGVHAPDSTAVAGYH